MLDAMVESPNVYAAQATILGVLNRKRTSADEVVGEGCTPEKAIIPQLAELMTMRSNRQRSHAEGGA